MKEQTKTADGSVPEPMLTRRSRYQPINATRCIIAFIVCASLLILAMLILKAIVPDVFKDTSSDLLVLIFSIACSATASWLFTAIYFRKGREKELEKHASMAMDHLKVVSGHIDEICDRIKRETIELEEDDSELSKEKILGILGNIDTRASSIGSHIKLGEKNWRRILAADIETYREEYEQYYNEREQEKQNTERQINETSVLLDEHLAQENADHAEISRLRKRIESLVATMKDISSQQESVTLRPFPPGQSSTLPILTDTEARAHAARGYTYYEGGDFNRAIKEYDRAIELKPDYVLAYNNRGGVYGKKGEFDRAIQDYDKAIELDPDYVDAYVGRACAYIVKGKFDQAIQDCDKAIELDPECALAWYNRACGYSRKNEKSPAIESLQKAIALE